MAETEFIDTVVEAEDEDKEQDEAEEYDAVEEYDEVEHLDEVKDEEDEVEEQDDVEEGVHVVECDADTIKSQEFRALPSFKLEDEVAKAADGHHKEAMPIVTQSAGPGCSESEEECCGICYVEFAREVERGILNCCSHKFCFSCIHAWSKVESRCPMCKRRFEKIIRKGGLKLKRPGYYRIAERDQKYEPRYEAEEPTFLEPYALCVCLECGEGKDESLLLLCDNCDGAFHTYCIGLGAHVPSGNWYCDSCVSFNSGTMSQSVSGITQHLNRGNDSVTQSMIINDCIGNFENEDQITKVYNGEGSSGDDDDDDDDEDFFICENGRFCNTFSSRSGSKRKQTLATKLTRNARCQTDCAKKQKSGNSQDQSGIKSDREASTSRNPIQNQNQTGRARTLSMYATSWSNANRDMAARIMFQRNLIQRSSILSRIPRIPRGFLSLKRFLSVTKDKKKGKTSKFKRGSNYKNKGVRRNRATPKCNYKEKHRTDVVENGFVAFGESSTGMAHGFDYDVSDSYDMDAMDRKSSRSSKVVNGETSVFPRSSARKIIVINAAKNENERKKDNMSEERKSQDLVIDRAWAMFENAKLLLKKNEAKSCGEITEKDLNKDDFFSNTNSYGNNPSNGKHSSIDFCNADISKNNSCSIFCKGVGSASARRHCSGHEPESYFKNIHGKSFSHTNLKENEVFISNNSFTQVSTASYIEPSASETIFKTVPIPYTERSLFNNELELSYSNFHKSRMSERKQKVEFYDDGNDDGINDNGNNNGCGDGDHYFGRRNEYMKIDCGKNKDLICSNDKHLGENTNLNNGAINSDKALNLGISDLPNKGKKAEKNEFSGKYLSDHGKSSINQNNEPDTKNSKQFIMDITVQSVKKLLVSPYKNKLINKEEFKQVARCATHSICSSFGFESSSKDRQILFLPKCTHVSQAFTLCQSCLHIHVDKAIDFVKQRS